MTMRPIRGEAVGRAVRPRPAAYTYNETERKPFLESGRLFIVYAMQ